MGVYDYMYLIPREKYECLGTRSGGGGQVNNTIEVVMGKGGEGTASPAAAAAVAPATGGSGASTTAGKLKGTVGRRRRSRRRDEAAAAGAVVGTQYARSRTSPQTSRWTDAERKEKERAKVEVNQIKDKVAAETPKAPRKWEGEEDDVEMREVAEAMEVDPPPRKKSVGGATTSVKPAPAAPVEAMDVSGPAIARKRRGNGDDLRREVLVNNAKRRQRAQQDDRDLMRLLVEDRLKTLQGRRMDTSEDRRDRKRRIVHELRNVHERELTPAKKLSPAPARGTRRSREDDDELRPAKKFSPAPARGIRRSHEDDEEDGLDGYPVPKRHARRPPPPSVSQTPRKRGAPTDDEDADPFAMLYRPPEEKRANTDRAGVRPVGKVAGVKRTMNLIDDQDVSDVRTLEEQVTGIPFKSRPVTFDDDDVDM